MVLILKGQPAVVEEFLHRFRAETIRVRRWVADGTYRASAIHHGDPWSVLQVLIDEGLATPGLEESGDLDELMAVFEIVHRPRGGLADDENWRASALKSVQAALEEAGLVVDELLGSDRLPIDATEPDDGGHVVGLVVAHTTNLRLDWVGMVRVDEQGVLRLSPKRRDWKGPWVNP
jgi:hypothetical protein